MTNDKIVRFLQNSLAESSVVDCSPTDDYPTKYGINGDLLASHIRALILLLKEE